MFELHTLEHIVKSIIQVGEVDCWKNIDNSQTVAIKFLIPYGTSQEDLLTADRDLHNPPTIGNLIYYLKHNPFADERHKELFTCIGELKDDLEDIRKQVAEYKVYKELYKEAIKEKTEGE